MQRSWRACMHVNATHEITAFICHAGNLGIALSNGPEWSTRTSFRPVNVILITTVISLSAATGCRDDSVPSLYAGQRQFGT